MTADLRAQPTATDPIFDRVVAAIRATFKGALPPVIMPTHSFVSDLGFDSMGIALLGLGLEDQFDCAILLDGWIAEHSHPASLTVQSLCVYIERSLTSDERSALQA
jgi:acyl carrier protein